MLKNASPEDRDEQMRLMVQSLLAERFQLKASFATKDLPVYLLTVAKGGLKCPKVAPETPFATTPRPRMVLTR